MPLSPYSITAHYDNKRRGRRKKMGKERGMESLGEKMEEEEEGQDE